MFYLTGLGLMALIYVLNREDVDHVVNSIIEIIKNGRRNSD